MFARPRFRQAERDAKRFEMEMEEYAMSRAELKYQQWVPRLSHISVEVQEHFPSKQDKVFQMKSCASMAWVWIALRSCIN